MKIEISGTETFPDASGAPAVVTVEGYSFSFELLGEIRQRLITVSNRKPSAKVIGLAAWKYSEYL